MGEGWLSWAGDEDKGLGLIVKSTEDSGFGVRPSHCGTISTEVQGVGVGRELG